MRAVPKREAACAAAFCLAMGAVPFAAARVLPDGSPAGISAAAIYLLALAVGLHAAPKLADAMLARKLDGWLDWFDRGAAAYTAWREKEPSREPNPRSKDSAERRLAAWRRDVATQAASGALPRKLYDKAAAAGVPFAESIDRASLPSMEALEGKYGPSASAAPARRCALGLALAAGVSVLAMGPAAFSLRMAATLSLEGVLLCLAGVSALCDERARVLPFELSYACYPLALAAAATVSGAHGLVDAAVGMALCFVAMSGSAWVVGLAKGIPGAGGGDRRLAPALAAACGMPGAAVFMVAAYALYLVAAAPALARREATLSSRAPLGLWLLAGLGCGLSVLNGGIDWLGLGIAR